MHVLAQSLTNDLPPEFREKDVRHPDEKKMTYEAHEVPNERVTPNVGATDKCPDYEVYIVPKDEIFCDGFYEEQFGRLINGAEMTGVRHIIQAWVEQGHLVKYLLYLSFVLLIILLG